MACSMATGREDGELQGQGEEEKYEELNRLKLMCLCRHQVINVGNRNGKNIFHHACQVPNATPCLPAVRCQILNGTALQFRTTPELAETLIEMGADVNACTRRGAMKQQAHAADLRVREEPQPNCGAPPQAQGAARFLCVRETPFPFVRCSICEWGDQASVKVKVVTGDDAMSMARGRIDEHAMSALLQAYQAAASTPFVDFQTNPGALAAQRRLLPHLASAGANLTACGGCERRQSTCWGASTAASASNARSPTPCLRDEAKRRAEAPPSPEEVALRTRVSTGPFPRFSAVFPRFRAVSPRFRAVLPQLIADFRLPPLFSLASRSAWFFSCLLVCCSRCPRSWRFLSALAVLLPIRAGMPPLMVAVASMHGHRGLVFGGGADVYGRNTALLAAIAAWAEDEEGCTAGIPCLLLAYACARRCLAMRTRARRCPVLTLWSSVPAVTAELLAACEEAEAGE
eukprot:3916653-Rhodomonas_salina.3